MNVFTRGYERLYVYDKSSYSLHYCSKYDGRPSGPQQQNSTLTLMASREHERLFYIMITSNVLRIDNTRNVFRHTTRVIS